MQHKRNKIRIALVGSPAAPKLFSALQMAYGICGSWERVIVLGSSTKDSQYQHIGPYSTLGIPGDAIPQRYSDLLNLCAGAYKEVIIFSTLSEEWKSVTQYLNASYYEDVLKAHRHLFNSIRHSPVHIIACVDTQKMFSCQDPNGKPKLGFISKPIQQHGFERIFNTVVQMDKRGTGQAIKDISKTLPGVPFKLTQQAGAMLQDWCYQGKPIVSPLIQQKIDACNSLSALYQLLFDLDIEEEELFQAFTKRRLELDELYLKEDTPGDRPPMNVIQGGQV
jgi:hypothetical protein